MYFLVIQEIPAPARPLFIIVGSEMSEQLIDKYGKHMHQNAFSHPKPSEVREIVYDGHEGLQKCAEAPKKRAGRPRLSPRALSKTNGWFMTVDPSSGRILGLSYVRAE